MVDMAEKGVRGDASEEIARRQNDGAYQLRFRPPGHGEPTPQSEKVKDPWGGVPQISPIWMPGGDPG
jgi:hypothetical protein